MDEGIASVDGSGPSFNVWQCIQPTRWGKLRKLLHLLKQDLPEGFKLRKKRENWQTSWNWSGETWSLYCRSGHLHRNHRLSTRICFFPTREAGQDQERIQLGMKTGRADGTPSPPWPSGCLRLCWSRCGWSMTVACRKDVRPGCVKELSKWEGYKRGLKTWILRLPISGWRMTRRKVIQRRTKKNLPSVHRWVVECCQPQTRTNIQHTVGPQTSNKIANTKDSTCDKDEE
jgi:hypothetical protein